MVTKTYENHSIILGECPVFVGIGRKTSRIQNRILPYYIVCKKIKKKTRRPTPKE